MPSMPWWAPPWRPTARLPPCSPSAARDCALSRGTAMPPVRHSGAGPACFGAATSAARRAGTMREALQPYLGQRIRVTAPVQRLGTRIGWTGVKLPTLLVGPVLDADGATLADHLWLHVGRRIAAVAPQPGDMLTLTGRVKPYTRRRRQYHGTTLSYESELGLAYPARCAVVARAEAAICKSDKLSALNAPQPEPTKFAENANIPTEVPARARVLFALAVLSLEETEGVS